MTVDVLDNPAWFALTGPQARFAERYGRAARYHPDVSAFAALADPADPGAWRDLAVLTGPGGSALVAGPATPPPGWTVEFELGGRQYTGEHVRGEPDPEAIRLGPGDVPEMLDLVARTDPGPFRERTIELGVYLGLRRGDALVAMVGERQRVPGWTEVSAVCTDPAYRGNGLAGRLIRALVADVVDRGEQPFLHVADTNATGIRLYDRLGFTPRVGTVFRVVGAPPES